MRAQDIMTRPVLKVGPRTTVRDAIVLLTEHRVPTLPVVDENRQVIGIFTESDALRSGIIGGRLEANREVRAVMTTPATVVSMDTEVTDIARRMLLDGSPCAAVVEYGVLVGTVSRLDILCPLVRLDDAITSHLHELLADYAGHRDRWAVDVTAGLVVISGEFADEAERRVVAALAKTVQCVIDVKLVSKGAYTAMPLR